MMQFLTYVIALGFEGLNFVYKAAIAAYQSRKESRNENDVLDNTVTDNQLAPNPTEAQVSCDPTISNCPPTDRPVRPSRPIIKLKLGHVGEQTGVNVNGLSGGQEMVPFLWPSAPTSHQLFTPTRSQQSFQSIFRD